MWPRNPTPPPTSRQKHNWKRYMYLYVHSNTIHNSQDMETTYLSINRWVDKDVVHIYNGILLSHQKEWNDALCSKVDGPRDYHTKQSQKKKDKYHMVSHIYGIWNIIQINMSMKQKQIHRYEDLRLPSGRGGRGEKEQELGFGRGKRLYTGWINNVAFL